MITVALAHDLSSRHVGLEKLTKNGNTLDRNMYTMYLLM